MKDNYLLEKRQQVLTELKPLMDTLCPYKWDYIVTEDCREYLKIGSTLICCGGNSIWAIENEVYKWFIVHIIETRKLYLGHFHKHAVNVLTRYWKKESQ